MKTKPILASQIPARNVKSLYPEVFARKMEKRTKSQIGNYFGIQKFGVNRTEIEPGGQSSLMHRHSKQEEFIYILQGHPTLILESEEVQLQPGMCAGFTPSEEAHCLVNKTQELVIYLEVGDREAGDVVVYPKDDLMAEMNSDGKWNFKHKNGTSY